MTDNLMHSGLPLNGSAPVFPSLQEEGRAGGGYDVKIPTHPVPLFLQFKIPRVITRKSRYLPTNFTLPYMRMPIRTAPINQHDMLCDLESQGNQVFYATPGFWEIKGLDRYYRNGHVPWYSCYYRPNAMGHLAGDHYVAYEGMRGQSWLYSEPWLLEDPFDYQFVLDSLNHAIRQAPRQEPLEFLSKVRKVIEEIDEKAKMKTLKSAEYPGVSLEFKKPKQIQDENIPKPPPLKPMGPVKREMRETAYFAQVRLGCTFAVIGHD